jgi:CRP/FNR family transcriptional regulator
MTDAERIRVLSGVPLFSGLSSDEIAAIATVGRGRSLGKGETLFLAGQPAEGFWVVLSGAVKLLRLSPGGREQILHVHGPAETFAEATLAEGSRYPAGAIATEDSEVLLVPRAGFQSLLARRPVLATNLIARLSMRLREMAVLVEDLSLREAPARLARYLLDLVEEGARPGTIVSLPIRKGELASLLGTRQETLSRAFRHLADLDLVEVRGAAVELLDPDGLADAAAGE